MKIIFKNRILLMILILSVAVSSAQGLWTSKADYAGITSYINYTVGFSIGTKGYIGLGYDTSDKKDFWEFDPSLNTWTQKADIGGIARKGAVGFSIGSKGYIGTGLAGSSLLTDFWEYDPGTNIWMQKADFAGAGRFYATGFSIANKGYIGTGDTALSGANYATDFWEYDPLTDVWTQIPSFPGIGKAPAVGFAIGSKGYFGTGNADISDLPTKDFWEYDPISQIWTQKADVPKAKCSAVGFSIGAKGYIGTGINDTSALSKDLWEYNQATDTWIQKADFAGIARKHASAFSIGGKGYIGVGGTSDFWEFDPTIIGIDEILIKSLSIYPNPSNGIFTFELCENASELEIYNTTGEKILTKSITGYESEIDLTKNSKGTYIYILRTKDSDIATGLLIVK